MKTKNQKPRFISLIAILMAISGIIILESCGDDLSMQPKGDYISGYALFIDTNYIHAGGYYAAALYNSAGSPFTNNPITTQKIDMSKQYPYYYRISWDGEGACFVAIVWVHEPNPDNKPPMILGTYGCDTTHSCSASSPVAFPNFSGAIYNITCWADTVKCLN